jgi:hypothetical protein
MFLASMCATSVTIVRGRGVSRLLLDVNFLTSQAIGRSMPPRWRSVPRGCAHDVSTLLHQAGHHRSAIRSQPRPGVLAVFTAPSLDEFRTISSAALDRDYETPVSAAHAAPPVVPWAATADALSSSHS